MRHFILAFMSTLVLLMGSVAMASGIPAKTSVTGNEVSVIDGTDSGKISPEGTTMTAGGILEKALLNSQGEEIAVLKDIILDQDGQALVAVVSGKGFAGIGDKLVAMDYSLITERNDRGDVIAPVTEEMLAEASEFSYDPNDAEENVLVIPVNCLSASALMNGNLIDQSGEAIADVTDITFRQGRAEHLIVSFKEESGFPLQMVALDYPDLELVTRGEDNRDFRMSPAQAAHYDTLRKTGTN